MTAIALWLWATLAGLDLVSVLQALFSRPLVVGAGAGLLLGDVEAGLRLGALLELFALDVVPVGSTRYPDFSAASAGAVVAAAGPAGEASFGIAVAVGLALAVIGGTTIPVTRRLNARIVRAYADRLSAGDPVAIRAVQLTCLGHDVVRSAVVAAVALAIGWLVSASGWRPDPALARALDLAALAGAAWAVAHGAMASARSGPRWRWAAAGLATGVLVTAWR